jgi:transcriptional regulator with XRE-family HTH domain
MTPPGPHDELRQARLRRGWSRPELAARLQQWEAEHGSGRELAVDRNALYRWETGKRGVSEFYAIRLEAVLGIPRERLVDRRSRRASPPDAATGQQGGSPSGQDPGVVVANAATASPVPVAGLRRMTTALMEIPSQPYAPETVTEIRRTLLGYGVPGRLAVHGADPTLAVAALGRRVTRAWQLRQEARYVTLGGLLPGLLGDTELAANELPDQHRDHAFLPTGRLLETKEVALSAASMLEPGLASSRAKLAAWGGLLLTAALASARQGEWAETWELFGEAKTASRRLGHDYADLHTIFGPTNLAIHGVQLAVELGDGPEALRRAGRVDPDRLPASLLERRSHFLIDVARGHAQRRGDAAAVAMLLRAEQVASEEVHFNPQVHALVQLFLHRERKGAVPELRGLADRIGLLN